MSDSNKEIGRRIEELRKAVKLNQAEIGRALGVGKTTVSKYENGDTERGVPAEILAKIANIGNVTLDWLITGHDPPSAKHELTTEEIELLRLWNRADMKSRKIAMLALSDDTQEPGGILNNGTEG